MICRIERVSQPSLHALEDTLFDIFSYFNVELFWVQILNRTDVDKIKNEILSHPLKKLSSEKSYFPQDEDIQFSWWCIEKCFLPGVTDNPSHVLSEAIELVCKKKYECRSGKRLWIQTSKNITSSLVTRFAQTVFANPLIEKIEVYSLAQALEKDLELFKNPYWPEIQDYKYQKLFETYEFTGLSSSELLKLSKEKLWALNQQEMQIIQRHFLNKKVTDVEIEVLAQTWSEHCKHKIFAAEIEIENLRDDIELPQKVRSVFKTYIKGATQAVSAKYLRSVFDDNAGIIEVSEDWDCAIKVETHNSPSALDPYGGSLTGIVGVNRDILGAGLGAEPIANLDVFCVGPLEISEKALPPRLHHPRRILEGVRMGVEHGGNKSGIPTVTGAVVHHPDYLGKPLVFCGTVGLLPRKADLIHKKILPEDKIVVVGGRIGKDGIHGATFSSLALDEHSPVSAVQLGDPLTQKRVWDFLIEARDLKLFRAVTDNGAGGLSSSIGELARLCGKNGGAKMDVARAKTKYPGLKPFEYVVSESQERMSFAVPPENLEQFLDLASRRGVECSVLGEFLDTGRFHILFNNETIADLDMHFLHEGCPTMHLHAQIQEPKKIITWQSESPIKKKFLERLAHPNVCSRHWIVQQYDHEVQARTVRKPYGSPDHKAPGDGATLRLSRTSFDGIALGLGLAPELAEFDAYYAAQMALDESVRNAVAAGMDPSHAALVDNFCWPDPLPPEEDKEGLALDAKKKLGDLILSCKALYDGAVDLQMPFVSGKDSMKNDYKIGNKKISVPPTVLVTVFGKVHDVRVVPAGYALNKNQYVYWISGLDLNNENTKINFKQLKGFYKSLHECIQSNVIESIHDVSLGGWLCTTAELFFGTQMSVKLENTFSEEFLFSEPAASFVVCIDKNQKNIFEEKLKNFWVKHVGESQLQSQSAKFYLNQEIWEMQDLERAYFKPY